MQQHQSYFICATPRTGSTLLCNLLTQTGQVGRPDSYFRRTSLGWWADHLGVETPPDSAEFDRNYVAAVLNEGRSGTVIFGCRIMQKHMKGLLAQVQSLHNRPIDPVTLLAKTFGTPVFIHLHRRDKLAQAVSYVIAQQSGLWHKAPDGTELERTQAHLAPVYDGNRLKTQVEEFVAYDLAWTHWFEAQGIAPLSLAYEVLAENPRGGVALILKAIGLSECDLSNLEPGVARLSNEVNQDWVSRYKAEFGDPRSLP